MATKKIEFKLPEKVEITRSFWGWLFSILAIAGLLVYMLVPAVRGWLGTPEPGFNAGVLVAVGLLILVIDRISIPIVKQHNVGWLFLVIGAYFILWRSLGPLAEAVWSKLAPAHISYLVIGVVLVLVAWFILKRRK